MNSENTPENRESILAPTHLQESKHLYMFMSIQELFSFPNREISLHRMMWFLRCFTQSSSVIFSKIPYSHAHTPCLFSRKPAGRKLGCALYVRNRDP